MPEKTPPNPPANRFKTEMPRIPGVGDVPPAALSPVGSGPEPERSNSAGRTALLSVALGITLVLVVGIGWWVLHSAGRSTPTPQETAEPAPAAPDLATSTAPQASGPVNAVPVSELAKPWAGKEFTFLDPLTHDSVPAMAVHLGGAAPESSSSYWAFSLEAPYQTCHLAYVTDLSDLATRFGYQGASHPMVASPCDSTVYDPLKMGTIASGAWVRGEIVQGAGIRPPISIEVKVEGNQLVADRIE